ncbi:MAG: tRNA (adenosine(37)-N6)-dimethylallyltransferase MiaA [Candidatus Omnitrophica bacterium]|nr:tRNA (adenosine(37)-N6)-dimethylallyltransferase MiaA [Candidatus Omnitrophota bacterium]
MRDLIALIGPTAVGKTDISIELAKRLDAEIIGCDSMQVYRGMSRLTTQPTPEQRETVPHHLIDCIDPTESFSVGRYRQLALSEIEAVQRQGKTSLIVGGTGLYLKALTNGLCEAPAADERLRATLWEAVKAEGSETHHRRLQTIDPLAASKIHPHDARRVVRALEVYEVTGRPLSNFWRSAPSGTWDQAGEATPITVIGLTSPREELYDRINRRVERMIEDEAVLEEVRRLRKVPLSLTAQKVHGLRFLEAYLKGTASREETIRVWQQQVRRYARRQLTWFRAMPKIQWISLGKIGDTNKLLDFLEKVCVPN